MERRGFGRKTFSILYEDGKVQVDVVEYKMYDFLNSNMRNDERFPQHINIFFNIETNNSICGSGGHFTNFAFAQIYGNCWTIATLNHEIGHALGLDHNFRDGSLVMSYGVNPSGEPVSQLSEAEASQLDRHPSFNNNLFSIVNFDYHINFMNYNSSEVITRKNNFTFKFKVDYDPQYHDLLVDYNSATFQEVTEEWMIIEEFNHFTEKVKYKITGNEIEYALTFDIHVNPNINAASIRMKGPLAPIVQVGQYGLSLQ